MESQYHCPQPTITNIRNVYSETWDSDTESEISISDPTRHVLIKSETTESGKNDLSSNIVMPAENHSNENEATVSRNSPLSDLQSPLDDVNMSFVSVNVSTIKRQIDNGRFWSEFTTVKAKGDGHCIIHSLCMCMRALSLNCDDSLYGDMLMKLRAESLSNMSSYIIAITDCSWVDMIIEMIRYIYLKHYNTSFGDVVPHIMAEALSVNVFIVEERPDGSCDVFSANLTYKTATFNVFLYKRGHHYDACIPRFIHGYDTS